jgi:hypothetical protein
VHTTGRPPGALLALLVGFVVLVLAGCRLDVVVDVTMDADGAGSVTVTATVDEDVLRDVPDVLNDLRLSDATDAGWAVTGPSVAPGGGATVTLTKPFRSPDEGTAVLAELSGPAGPFKDLALSRSTSFARVASGFSGVAQLDGGLVAFADSALVEAVGGVPLADRVTEEELAAGLAVTVRVRLAGTVQSADGVASADGDEVAWTPVLAGGTATAMNASFEQVDQGALDARRTERLARAGLVAWVVFSLVVVAVVWRRRAVVRARSARRGTTPGTRRPL